jgi:hypothetical protein
VLASGTIWWNTAPNTPSVKNHGICNSGGGNSVKQQSANENAQHDVVQAAALTVLAVPCETARFGYDLCIMRTLRHMWRGSTAGTHPYEGGRRHQQRLRRHIHPQTRPAMAVGRDNAARGSQQIACTSTTPATASS